MSICPSLCKKKLFKYMQGTVLLPIYSIYVHVLVLFITKLLKVVDKQWLQKVLNLSLRLKSII